MRKTLALLALPALLFGTVAAGDPNEGCSPDAEVLAAGESMTFEASGVESFTFKVDPTASEKGRVTVDATMTWDNRANDWDLGVNGTLSENYQPFDDPIETASYTAKGGCRTVVVEVIDFLAPLPELNGITIEVSVR